MKTLRQELAVYLETRRSLGYRLHREGIRLVKFTEFMDEKRASHVTTPLALEWALKSLPALGEPAKRLIMVRGFATYLHALDERNEIPPQGLVPNKLRRVRPYLYSSEEIASLLDAAWSRSPYEQPIGTYYCLFGLLAVAGLRVGEAIRLMDQDVDLAAATMSIHGAKFGKSRLIPLHPTTVRALRDYRRRRNEWLGNQSTTHFFVSSCGKPLLHTCINRVFSAVRHKVGLREKVAGRRPRLHDFRHRFAVQTLIRWYQSGEDAERRLPVLSTFLGHVCVADTYWYLTAHPELMHLAAARLNLRWENRS